MHRYSQALGSILAFDRTKRMRAKYFERGRPFLEVEEENEHLHHRNSNPHQRVFRTKFHDPTPLVLLLLPLLSSTQVLQQQRLEQWHRPVAHGIYCGER